MSLSWTFILSSAVYCEYMWGIEIGRTATFYELAAIDLARCNLKRNNVTLRSLASDATEGLEGGARTAASLRSLIGMPIVLVIVSV